ncbi:MAG: nitrate ABC transporter ATP-binding protein [Aphanocapsa sp. GSE-SYN-MK-11-07L]|jgi:nitrate/nitrite transport system ATP-binding protein|nr:nitrate ABC transporter ATP-binding protein [Aphanocapsa sp. GSE-SYN-MK-11-07L]
MSVFVEIDHIDKVFPLGGGKSYTALKSIDLNIKQGEFVTLIGHSGCGKSTLLNIVAGLDQPTQGGIVLEGRQVKQPGPDRMVVFQNYSLLPWLTVEKNVALGVNKVLKDLPAAERKQIVDHHIEMVGLKAAAHKKPHELSGGMKQRVAIARALSLRPKLLLLDEPFGALDALTRGHLQAQLMQICQESKVTCLMVTHDVDEALLLSDRVVMLTNGPESHIGQILAVPIPRPRLRLEVVNHPSYYALRGEMIYFLNQQKRDKQRKSKQAVAAIESKPLAIARHGLEKINLDLGFIPLTDCAPLVVAKEKGIFAAYGLEEVTLHREPSWKAIVEGVASQRLDAAQMVAGMPLSMTLGLGVPAPLPIVTALVMSRNGNAITLSKQLYDQGVRSLADFKAVIEQTPDKVHTLGIVHPASMHNLMLRYWLAAGGIDPDLDVNLIVIPPAQMVANLMAGNIDGYCVGEPWNTRAIQEGLGFAIATDLDIWPGHPEKVLGVREDWVNQYPQTHIALVKALLDACEYCDDRRNRAEIAELLAQPQYVGAALEHIRPGLIDPYLSVPGGEPQPLLRYNQFFVNRSACPERAEGLWVLTQLARWGITTFPKNWVEVIERTRRVDLYGEAARQLGLFDSEPDAKPFALFDGVVFDPNDPVGYIHRSTIQRPICVDELSMDNSMETLPNPSR